MTKYFGTDGIRGRLGDAQIQPSFILQLGWAAGRVLAPDGGLFLIARDSRHSGELLASALQTGLMAAGARVISGGILPTPAVAYLTELYQADAGIVISASHNPYQDNGIKFFNRHGFKLSDEQEQAIENLCHEPMQLIEPFGQVEYRRKAEIDYQKHCLNRVPELDLNGLNIVLDCAHGAMYRVAPAVFSQLGAELILLGSSPNGYNINRNVGSTHPERLKQAVLAEQAHLGIAFDGDGDRLILVDEQGQIRDGDAMLYLLAMQLKQQNRLNGAVIGTVMSNYGLEQALKANGIDMIRTPVGDRHILAELQSGRGVLGGEPSGHLIHFEHSHTGDGLLNALLVLNAIQDQPASKALAGFKAWPQHLINIRLKKKSAADIIADPHLQQNIERIQSQLGEQGRILIRPSGTEPLLRIMVETESAKKSRHLAQKIAALIEEYI